MYVPEDQGGAGLSRLDATLVFEALAEACPATSAFLSIHNMCAWMLATWGTDAARARHLPGLLTLEHYCAYCLTEPGSGSDAAALTTRATRTATGYALTGAKAFISGGGFADLYLVMARTGAPARRASPPSSSPPPPPASPSAPRRRRWAGAPNPPPRSSSTPAAIPADHLLGAEGDGFRYAMAGLDGGRLNIAAAALGGAQSALARALAYTRDRHAFGRPLSDFQALQFRLADMETDLQAARVFLRQAAWKLDRKAPDASKHCAMAKRLVTDTAFRVANDALQLLGGYGYLADYGIEKIVRDLRVHQILEGTNEIMRVIVARALLAEHA